MAKANNTGDKGHPCRTPDLTVNEFTKELMLNNDLEIFDADTWRPYCHVIDFSRLIYSVVTAEINTKYFEVFNVGSDENNYTKRQRD